MTFLSRIRINPLRGESRKLLANPHVMHGAVLGGIADQPTSERVLWRLDSDNPRRPMLFVLTQSKPDWAHLIENAGWPDADGEHAAVRDYTPLLAQLAVGRQFAFRLTANPVQNTFTPEKPTAAQLQQKARNPRRAHRIGHRTAAHQLGWFLNRSDTWGFRIPPARTDPAIQSITPIPEAQEPPAEARIVSRERRTFSKRGTKKPVQLHLVTFEGLLEITDVPRLTERLLGGIGPAKAYGCGLLTLAPPGNATTGG